MTGIRGIAPTPRLFGALQPALAPELGQLTEVASAPAAYVRAPLIAVAGAFRAPAATRWAIAGCAARGFVEDYYDRVHLTPQALALGNVVSQVVRTVSVWNAWRTRSLRLDSAQVTGDPGITATAPAALPLTFAPLQERDWTLTVASDGPPLIDARLVFAITTGEVWSLTITGQRLQAWGFLPDWREDLIETLAWSTTVQTTLAGQSIRTPLRDAPRRSWEFSLLAGRSERRQIENLLYDWSARVWALPVFVDTTWLRNAVPAGATAIALDTTGLDFVIGGLAMLWRSERAFELVEVVDKTGERLGLRAPTQAAWPAGTRLIPCRTARLARAPELRRHSDQLMSTAVRFEAVEPCDWPARAPMASYRGRPVLESPPDESDDPTATYTRTTTVLDNASGVVAVDDFSGLTTTTQSHAWRVFGREARSAHRSLLYWLQGRAEALWLPTWTDDVEVIEPIGERATTLVVAWAGIARSLHQQPGRRHLRIELHDGRVFYRAVEAANEVERSNGETHERVRVDAALGVGVGPERVRRISWMALCTLAGDTVELHHVNAVDGLLDVAVQFASVSAEEP